MKTSFAVAAILFALTLAAACAPAQQMAPVHCVAVYIKPGATHTTVYVSQILPMELSQRMALSGAWATYIKTTYHLETISSSFCQPLSANPTIQERVLTAEETAWKNQGWELVRVNWKPGQSASSDSDTSMYGAAGATPPAPAATPAMPSGPEPRASYCYSDDKKPTIYFSDPFDTAGLPSATAWSTAFTKMLAQKYAYKGIVTCKNASTIVSAQSMILEQRDALQGKQFIDTDWTYEPPAPPSTQ